MGIKTSAPDLPSTLEPDREAWIDAVLKLYNPKDKTIFVGRSLGGSLIPYLLELDNVRAKAAISIAAPIDNLGWPNLVNFFSRPVDFAKAKKAAGKYYHWYSDDDPYIPLEHGLKYQSQLGGKFKVFPGRSHFYDEEFPELLDLIKDIYGLK